MHIVQLSAFLLVISVAVSQSQMISNRKSAFIDHINNFLNKIASPQDASNVSIPSTTKAPSTTPSRANIPVARFDPSQPAGVVVNPNENPAAAVNRLQNSVLAINLMQTIAPPAVRPCFVRPAFCPATSDACSTSRCARLYANGVRIGSRFYKRVKCRLNYCRETCGKAEWYADGRRLIGCSDSSSTLDSPVWASPRVYPRPARLDSRILPIERVANTRVPPGAGGVDFSSVQTESVKGGNSVSVSSNPQRRSVQAWIGDLGETFANKTRELGESMKAKFDELNDKRKQDAVSRASNITLVEEFNRNLTAFVDKQLEEATSGGVEHDTQHEEHHAIHEDSKSSGQQQAKKTDFWFILFLVGLFYSR